MTGSLTVAKMEPESGQPCREPLAMTKRTAPFRTTLHSLGFFLLLIATAAAADSSLKIKVELASATLDGAQAQLDVLDDLGSGGVVTDERPVARPRRVPLDAVDVARSLVRHSDGVVAHHEVLKVPPARRVCRKLDPAAPHVSGVPPRDHVFPSDIVREGSKVGEEAVNEPVLDLQSLAIV